MHCAKHGGVILQTSSDNADAQFDQQMPFPSDGKTQEQEGGGGPISPFRPTAQEQNRFLVITDDMLSPKHIYSHGERRQGTSERSGLKCDIAGNNGGPVECLGSCISNLIFGGNH